MNEYNITQVHEGINTFIQEEKYIDQRNKLKEKVRSLIGQQHGLIEQLEFVDALCQLGLDYHFHSEIKNLLCFIISSMEDENNSIEENNLNGSALLFRLLREHGINNASIQRYVPIYIKSYGSRDLFFDALSVYDGNKFAHLL